MYFKKLNRMNYTKKVESIIECLTELDGGHAVGEGDVKDAVIELNELKKDLESNSSFDDVKIMDALFEEYNKSYRVTKEGQAFPRWLNDEQLNWIFTVIKSLK